jgi:cytochrome c553
LTTRSLTWLLVLAAAATGVPAAAEAESAPERQFREQVWPILLDNCFHCHGARSRLRGDLRLTTREGVLAGGAHGPAVDLEQPQRSLLLQMISYRDAKHEMPPKGKLPQHQIDVLAAWVAAGAPWSPDVEPPLVASASDPDEEERPELSRDDEMSGWSYRKLRRPPVAEVERSDWVANPIDAFILARLEAAGLEPSPPADPVALLRRAHFDLTGLPPSPREVDAFIHDQSPGAFANVVDRLLASPRYGERWGRHWLDLVRYADTHGYERDSDKPSMWRYRDYVIDAFNQDKPYDRFVLEQLAGDELEDRTHESTVATGYYRLMIWDDEPPEGPVKARYDMLDDVVSTTGQVFLGMTLGCARCHDHKGDPISQKDYYSFLAFFAGIRDVVRDPEANLTEIMTPAERALYEDALAIQARERAHLEAALGEIGEAFDRAVAEDPRRGAPPSDLVGAELRIYRGAWEALPDFGALEPAASRPLTPPRLDLGDAAVGTGLALVVEGELEVPEDAEYTFGLGVAGGGRLSVDGTVVIDHDGLNEAGDKVRGTVALRRGRAPLRLEVFSPGEAAVELWWSRGEPAWRYSLEDPGPGWTAPEFDDSAWPAAPAGFGIEGTKGALVRTRWDGEEIWLRRSVDWGDAGPAALTVGGHHDRDVRIFLNGVEATRESASLERYVELPLFEPARGALRPGRNALAVHCRGSGEEWQYVDAGLVHRDWWGTLAAADLVRGRRPLVVTPGVSLDERLQERSRTVLPPAADARHRELRGELLALEKRELPRRVAFAVRENEGPVPDVHVLQRGNPELPGQLVKAAVPREVDPFPIFVPAPHPSAPSSGRRLALARWLVEEATHLTARVMANRLWQHHFGRGLVRSSNDFGELGDRPTHPGLLDWLAAELVARDWSLKSMHRLIMASRAYRMSSRASETGQAQDPGNDLFWRFDMRRLTAEEVRDSMLAVSGQLNLEMGGPGFFEPMPEAVLATSSRPEKVWGVSPPEETWRRSVYIKVKRSLLPPMLESFDLADTDLSCPVRLSTTQPTQALNMLNSRFTAERAAAFAERLGDDAGIDRAAQVRRALRLALARSPSEEEVGQHLELLGELEREHGLSPRAALEKLCLVILNLNELVYLD